MFFMHQAGQREKLLQSALQPTSEKHTQGSCLETETRLDVGQDQYNAVCRPEKHLQRVLIML